MMMGNIGRGDTWLSHAEPTMGTVDLDGRHSTYKLLFYKTANRRWIGDITG